MAAKIVVKGSSLVFFLQLIVGFFFILMGIYGVMPSIQESVFSLSDNNLSLEVIFGVLELVCGIILLGGLFLYSRKKVLALASFIVFIFWAARIVLTKFILGITMRRGTFYFTGGLAHWLLILAVELIILISILIIYRKYAA